MSRSLDRTIGSWQVQTVHIGAVIEGGRDVAIGPDQYGGQRLLVGCCGDDVDALTPAVGNPAQHWSCR